MRGRSKGATALFSPARERSLFRFFLARDDLLRRRRAAGAPSDVTSGDPTAHDDALVQAPTTSVSFRSSLVLRERRPRAAPSQLLSCVLSPRTDSLSLRPRAQGEAGSESEKRPKRRPRALTAGGRSLERAATSSPSFSRPDHHAVDDARADRRQGAADRRRRRTALSGECVSLLPFRSNLETRPSTTPLRLQRTFPDVLHALPTQQPLTTRRTARTRRRRSRRPPLSLARFQRVRAPARRRTARSKML